MSLSPSSVTIYRHDMWFFYLPRICNHCTYPACLQACPRQPSTATGGWIVLLDQERCRGYQSAWRLAHTRRFYNHDQSVEKCVLISLRLRRESSHLTKLHRENSLLRFNGHRSDGQLSTSWFMCQLPCRSIRSSIGLMCVSTVMSVATIFDDAVWSRCACGDQPTRMPWRATILNYSAPSRAVSTDKTLVASRWKTTGHRVGRHGDEVRIPLKVPVIERSAFDDNLNVYRYNMHEDPWNGLTWAP